MSTSFKCVLAVGCFDGLHWGHIEHLRQASEMGGKLIVAVSSDEKVIKEKGEPVFCHFQRVAMVNSIKFVDYAFVNHVDTVEILEKLRPDIYVKGPDWNGKIPEHEKECCSRLGIVIAFTWGKKYSSRAIFKPRGVGDGDVGVE